MPKESEYLDSLQDPELYLDSPLPVELNGRTGNWVAFWMETGIEGEGISREDALEDFRKELLKQYRQVENKLKNSDPLSEREETMWVSMCHYIGSTKSGTKLPGTEFNDPNSGPIFG